MATCKQRSKPVSIQSFKNRLKAAMEQKNLNSAQLANRADLTPGSISMFLSGQRKPSADAIVKLAVALDTTTDFLLGVSDVNPDADLMQRPKIMELSNMILSLNANDQDRAFEMMKLFCQAAR